MMLTRVQFLAGTIFTTMGVGVVRMIHGMIIFRHIALQEGHTQLEGYLNLPHVQFPLIK
jgi:hypothetical protein